MTWETIIILGLVIAGLLFLGRFLLALLTVIFLSMLIIVGLAIASDLMTGSNALSQLADKIAPIAAIWFTGLVSWFRQKVTSSSP